MYHDDSNLGILGIGLPGIGDVIGFVGSQFSGGKVSKNDAIQGAHCPGVFSVEAVKGALDASTASVRSQARSIVLGNKGFSKELPRLSANDTLILARCLVWWAHGREDCKIGGDESKPIAFLTQLMARFDAAPPPPAPVTYTPPAYIPPAIRPAAPAPATAGISMNTGLLIAAALGAGFLFSR